MISDNINDKAEAIFNETLDFQAKLIKTTPIATELREKATAAIVAGQFKDNEPTADWITYMQLFAKTEQELDQLIPRNGTLDEVRQKARAYLVANGMCSHGTGTNIANGVANNLDL
jgi:hypothetical protein